jgi:hypothetical protein
MMKRFGFRVEGLVFQHAAPRHDEYGDGVDADDDGFRV